jgi:hypothetical protein
MLAPRVKDAREETEGRRSSRELLTMVLKTARRPSRDVRRDPLQFDVGRRDSVAVQGGPHSSARLAVVLAVTAAPVTASTSELGQDSAR